MAASTSTSLLLSFTFALLLGASMQLYKNQIAANEMLTIAGGFLGSILFVFLVTFIGNLEKLLFGGSFQMKLIPEIIPSLAVAVMFSASIHRVCASTCLIFSLIALYYVNKISQSLYTIQVATTTATPKKRK
jgi:hypothetical protein